MGCLGTIFVIPSLVFELRNQEVLRDVYLDESHGLAPTKEYPQRLEVVPQSNFVDVSGLAPVYFEVVDVRGVQPGDVVHSLLVTPLHEPLEPIGLVVMGRSCNLGLDSFRNRSMASEGGRNQSNGRVY